MVIHNSDCRCAECECAFWKAEAKAAIARAEKAEGLHSVEIKNYMSACRREREAKTRLDAVRAYGGHLGNCEYFRLGNGVTCDCGWSELQATLDGEEK